MGDTFSLAHGTGNLDQIQARNGGDRGWWEAVREARTSCARRSMMMVMLFQITQSIIMDGIPNVWALLFLGTLTRMWGYLLAIRYEKSARKKRKRRGFKERGRVKKNGI